MAALEVEELAAPGARDHLKVLLLPRDPNDDKKHHAEIRQVLAAMRRVVWAGDLVRMYSLCRNPKLEGKAGERSR